MKEADLECGLSGAKTARPIRILHLEEDRNDRILVREWLKAQGLDAVFTSVDNEIDFRNALKLDRIDIILSDNSMPQFDGLTALRLVKELRPEVPFIFVTGSMGEERAIETMKEGASDFILKNHLSRLFPAVMRSMREAEQARKGREAEEKIKEQATLLGKAKDAIFVTDTEERVLYWNHSAETIYGWASHEVLGHKITEMLPKTPLSNSDAKRQLYERGSWSGEVATVNRLGHELTVESRWTLVRGETGSIKSVLVIDTDITEKKQLELKFLRSQRMDSIGALAGGVAHDLNNALAPVIMGTEMLQNSADPNTSPKLLDIIASGAQRATSLVKQLLTFVRGSRGESAPIELLRVIKEIDELVQSTFPKWITCQVETPSSELWTIQGDTTEFHQLLLNLCVNARDAMPRGGTLKITAENITLEEETGPTNRASGPYVCLSVSDTGTGIPPDVLPRIFEPFFTTKAADKGTGLGLPTVQSIVKHYNGFIDVATELRRGTTFHVYIPATVSSAQPESLPSDTNLPTGRGELILVIDDEEAVLELTKTLLESCGYRVVAARNGIQGVDRFKENQQEIKLVITDTNMPFMNGLAAIRMIKALNPGLPVIMASGSDPDLELIRRENMAFLNNIQKPYRSDQLLHSVHAAITSHDALIVSRQIQRP